MTTSTPGWYPCELTDWKVTKVHAPHAEGNVQTTHCGVQLTRHANGTLDVRLWALSAPAEPLEVTCARCLEVSP